MKLLEEMGMSGLGVYLIMRLAIDSVFDGEMPIQDVLGICTKYTRGSKKKRVLYDFGLFDIIDDSLVRASVLAQAPAHTPAQAPKHTPEHVPIISYNTRWRN